MAQMGQLNPQTAVMAGMMIDRIVQSNTKPPQSTVAQDTFPDTVAMAPPAAQGLAGIPAGGMAPPPMDPSMMAPPAMGEPMLAASGGLLQLPVPDTMFNEDSFAGGGIVAFADAGSVRDPYNYRPFGSSSREMTEEEKEEQRRLRDAGFLEQLKYTGNKLFGPLFGAKSLQEVVAGPDVAKLPQAQVDYPDESRRGSAAGMTATTPGKSARDFGIGALPVLAGAGDTPIAGAAPAGSKPAAKTSTPTLSPFEEYQAMLKAAGVSNDFSEDRAANAAAREALAKDREQAKYMAILQAGLGMMGGTSPRALENIAKGIAPAVGDYTRATKDIKAEERDIAKVDRDMRKAEQALRRGDVDKYFEFKDKAEQREIQRLAATKPNATESLLAALSSKDPKVREAAQTVLGTSKTGGLTDKTLLDAWEMMGTVQKMRLKKENNIPHM
jgi:hypothetical protein